MHVGNEWFFSASTDNKAVKSISGVWDQTEHPKATTSALISLSLDMQNIHADVFYQSLRKTVGVDHVPSEYDAARRSRLLRHLRRSKVISTSRVKLLLKGRGRHTYPVAKMC